MAPTYCSYYLFGQSNGDPIWLWKNWQHVVPLLDPIVSSSSGAPAIGTRLHDKSRAPVKFGKMVWSLKHNETWSTKCGDANHTFYDTEIAFPSRSKCHKTRGLAPEVLIFVENGNLTDSPDPNVDQSIIIHVSNDRLTPDSRGAARASVDAIGRLLNASLVGEFEQRPESFPSPYGMGFTDAIWFGAHGVLNADSTDFSDTFKGYGITRLL